MNPNNNTNLVPSEMAPLLTEFDDVFQKPMGLPPSRAIESFIGLVPRESFPNAPTYCLARREYEEIERQIGQLLESCHIQPSSSPYASLAFIIPKKDDH